MPARRGLNGLSPKETVMSRRSITSASYRLKAALPQVPIIIIRRASPASRKRGDIFDHVDGVMLRSRGLSRNRGGCQSVDSELFGAARRNADMTAAIEAMMPYIANNCRAATRLHAITRHFVGGSMVFPARARSAAICRSTAWKADAGIEVLREALALVRPARACRGGVKASLKIAAQLQTSGRGALPSSPAGRGSSWPSRLVFIWPRGTPALRIDARPAGRPARRSERQPGGAGCCRRRFPPDTL